MQCSATSRRTLLAGGLATVAATLGTKGTARSPGSRPATEAGRRRFDRQRFVADCLAAHRADGMAAVREVLERAVSDHAAVRDTLGAPREAGLDVMHASSTFTIFAAHWTPQMNLLAHDHMMAALIGIYTGREDNILWRCGEAGIEAFGARCLFEGDIAALPADAIHSVTNPLQRFTGGIHIYDGDFFAVERHQWDPETLAEQRSDGDTIRAMFAAENERLRAPCRL